MAACREHGGAGPGCAARPGLPTALLLAALVLSDVVGTPWPATAGDPRAVHIVSVASAAYGHVGTLAVVLARQQHVAEGRTLRGAEAHSVRVAAVGAENGLADRPFPTASLVKLFIAEHVLHRARVGVLQLTPADRRELERMIRSSDDAAASDLWIRFGGGRMVRDVAARYGLTRTAPPRVWGEWGETTTSARDLARFLSRLPVVAAPADATTLLEWMRAVTPTAADGFDQRFGVLATMPDQPAVKQGWMCCVGGMRHLHSVGVIGSRVVVLLSEVPRSGRLGSRARGAGRSRGGGATSAALLTPMPTARSG